MPSRCVELSGWILSGTERFDSLDAGYPNVSPSDLHAAALPSVQARVEEDERHPVWAFGGIW